MRRSPYSGPRMRAIDTDALAIQKRKLAELLDVPRLRQIACNLVSLTMESPTAATLGDFVSQDLARMSALDTEIRAPRPAFVRSSRDRRDASTAKRGPSAATQSVPRRRRSQTDGTYE